MRPPETCAKPSSSFPPKLRWRWLTPWNGVIRAGTNWRAKPIWAWVRYAPALWRGLYHLLDHSNWTRANYTHLNRLKEVMS